MAVETSELVIPQKGGGERRVPLSQATKTDLVVGARVEPPPATGKELDEVVLYLARSLVREGTKDPSITIKSKKPPTELSKHVESQAAELGFTRGPSYIRNYQVGLVSQEESAMGRKDEKSKIGRAERVYGTVSGELHSSLRPAYAQVHRAFGLYVDPKQLTPGQVEVVLRSQPRRLEETRKDIDDFKNKSASRPGALAPHAAVRRSGSY